MLKHRLAKLEKQSKPERKAVFVTRSNGFTSGRALWRDDLEWKGLTRPEFEHIRQEMESEGVAVTNIEVVVV